MALATVASTALAADRRYENVRFGTTITYPDHVFTEPQPEPANGDGQVWLAPNGAELRVYGGYNVLEQTPDDLVAGRKDDGVTVTYAKTGRDWCVVSGLDAGRIFYERHEFGAEALHSVVVSYGAGQKAVYDPLVGKIAASLAGP